MNNIRKRPVLLFFAALIVLYVLIYVLPKVTGALTRDYTVQYGRLRTMDASTGYFVRKEKVYLADKGGIENRYIKEGALVRKGVKVMDINGNGSEEPQIRYKNILEKLGSSAIRVPSYKTQAEGIVMLENRDHAIFISLDDLIAKGKYNKPAKKEESEEESVAV